MFGSCGYFKLELSKIFSTIISIDSCKPKPGNLPEDVSIISYKTVLKEIRFWEERSWFSSTAKKFPSFIALMPFPRLLFFPVSEKIRIQERVNSGSRQRLLWYGFFRAKNDRYSESRVVILQDLSDLVDPLVVLPSDLCSRLATRAWRGDILASRITMWPGSAVQVFFPCYVNPFDLMRWLLILDVFLATDTELPALFMVELSVYSTDKVCTRGVVLLSLERFQSMCFWENVRGEVFKLILGFLKKLGTFSLLGWMYCFGGFFQVWCLNIQTLKFTWI